MARYLIAHCNAEVRDVLDRALWKVGHEAGESHDIQSKTNKAQALSACCERPFDFVITSLDLAADPTKPVESGRGLEVARWAHDHLSKTPVLLIAPCHRDEIEASAREIDAHVIYEDRLRRPLDDEVVQLVTGRPHAQPQQNWIDIEIDVDAETFTVSDDLAKIPPTRDKLSVNERKVTRLSAELATMVQQHEPSWNTKLYEVGEAIKQDLFERAPFKLRDAYGRALLLANCQEETTRVRFVVGRKGYQLPLEAVLCPYRHEHWMLQAPLYRAIRDDALPPTGMPARPLFEGEDDRPRPINCLIIDANTAGTVDDPPCELKPLSNTRTECELLDAMLKRNSDALNGGIVKTLFADELDEDAWPCTEQLQHILGETDWHVVHYAGHSYYDSARNMGYLFFPEWLSREPQPVSVRSFATWFQREKPRFFYLSSCESAAQDFAFELAVWAGLPAVAGFRWRIGEKAALCYAQSFYKHLFKLRCLELAFTQARRDARRAEEHDLTWASATLVIQSSR